MMRDRMVEGVLLSDAGNLLADMQQLRHSAEWSFNRLIDVTAIDQPDFLEVVYRLNSLAQVQDLTVRVRLDKEQPRVPSVSDLWESALFGEREVRDMFGIEFDGHPDLRPLLAPEEGFGFFPLRKDYNLPGREAPANGR